MIKLLFIVPETVIVSADSITTASCTLEVLLNDLVLKNGFFDSIVCIFFKSNIKDMFYFNRKKGLKNYIIIILTILYGKSVGQLFYF
jgi:hypothetical protein